MDTITVKPDLSLYERFLEGNYDGGFNKPITNESELLDTFSNFRRIDINTFGEWEYRLIPVPDKGIDLFESRKLCCLDGWTMGKNEHLLALGAKFPEEQANPILQIGSSANFSDEYVLFFFFTLLATKENRRIFSQTTYRGEIKYPAKNDLDLWIPPARLLSVRRIS